MIKNKTNGIYAIYSKSSNINTTKTVFDGSLIRNDSSN